MADLVLIVAAVLALAIGLSLGLLGGGGSILTVPLFVYALHVAPRPAIAESLFVVGVTSLVGAVVHARAGGVRLRVGLVFGGAGMAGAYAGGRLAHFVRGEQLLVVFGAIMLVTAMSMIRPRVAIATARRTSLPRLTVVGALVGAVAGLVGAGGGFLVVPALLLFGGLAMREAIGTSLLVIALQCLAGFAGQLAHAEVDWTLTLVVSAAAVGGSLAGVALSRRVSQERLRLAFGWFVLAMGIFVLANQLPLAPVVIIGACGVALALWLTRRGPSGPDRALPDQGQAGSVSFGRFAAFDSAEGNLPWLGAPRPGGACPEDNPGRGS